MEVNVTISVFGLTKKYHEQIKNFSERANDLIFRALHHLGINEVNQYHLYGLNQNFLEIPPKANLTKFLDEEYDYLVLIPGESVLYDVYFEGKHSQIALPADESTKFLINTAIRCFKIPTDDQDLMIVDTETHLIYPIDTPLPTRSVLLKCVDLFATDIIFNTIQLDITSESSLFVLSLPRIIFTQSFRTLLSAIKSIRNETIEIVEISETRFPKLFSDFILGSPIPSWPNAEKFSFLFSLLGASRNGLISPCLAQFAFDAIQIGNPVLQYQHMSAFVDFMPLQTHLIINELSQCFTGILSDETRNFLARQYALLLFSQIHATPEQEKLEILIGKYLVLFGQWLCHLPQRGGREVCTFVNQLASMETDSAGKKYIITIDKKEYVELSNERKIVKLDMKPINQHIPASIFEAKHQPVDCQTSLRNYNIAIHETYSLTEKMNELIEQNKERIAKELKKENLVKNENDQSLTFRSIDRSENDGNLMKVPFMETLPTTFVPKNMDVEGIESNNSNHVENFPEISITDISDDIQD